MAFKKTFSYAGFEMQSKHIVKPKIALLNIELELKAEKDNAEIRVESVEVTRRSLWRRSTLLVIVCDCSYGQFLWRGSVASWHFSYG